MAEKRKATSSADNTQMPHGFKRVMVNAQRLAHLPPTQPLKSGPRGTPLPNLQGNGTSSFRSESWAGQTNYRCLEHAQQPTTAARLSFGKPDLNAKTPLLHDSMAGTQRARLVHDQQANIESGFQGRLCFPSNASSPPVARQTPASGLASKATKCPVPLPSKSTSKTGTDRGLTEGPAVKKNLFGSADDHNAKKVQYNQSTLACFAKKAVPAGGDSGAPLPQASQLHLNRIQGISSIAASQSPARSSQAFSGSQTSASPRQYTINRNVEQIYRSDGRRRSFLHGSNGPLQRSFAVHALPSTDVDTGGAEEESEVLPGAQSLQDLDRFNKILAELHLNSEQRAAACSPHNLALLLRAGAGSGKTTTTIARILYFTLSQGIPPNKVRAITFTKKAAKEVEDRLGRVGVKGVTVQTFHSFGLSVIKSFSKEAGFSIGPPHILNSEPEQRSLLAEAMRWASLAHGKRRVVEWLGLSTTRSYHWQTLLEHVQTSDPAIFQKAEREADDYALQSLSKKEKADFERERDDAILGKQAGNGSKAQGKGWNAKRVDRLTRLEVILSVYNALLKKHEPKLWALLPKRDEKAKKLSDKYDFNVPGQAPGRKQVRCMHSWIKAQKNMGRGPEDFLQTTTEGLVFREYQDLLMKCQCVDYDDIMTLAVNLLGDKERPNIRQTVQNRCPYMLVDEYQDSNAIQVKLIELLQGDLNQITVVGDDFQSIYGFRGALPDVFPNFIEQFSHENLNQSLQMNYRSRPGILEAGMQVLKDTKSVLHKELKPARDAVKDRECVHVWQTGHPAQEAHEMMLEMKKLHEQQGVDYEDMVCLFRVMRSGKAKFLDQELLRAGIPHHIARGTAFMDQAVIKDVMGYIRLLLNPKDDPAFERVYNKPARRLGAKFFQALKRFRDNKKLQHTASEIEDDAADCSLLQCCKDMLKAGLVAATYKKSLQSFVKLLHDLRVESVKRTPSEILFDVIMKTGYWDSLLDEVQRKEAKRQEAEKADVQGLIHDVPEEDEDEEDKEEQEEQRKVLLDFAKQRDSNRPKENRKGKEGQANQPQMASGKSDQLCGPLLELYTMVEEYEQTYTFAENDFRDPSDGHVNGVPDLTRMAAVAAFRDVEAHRLTNDIAFDQLQHTAALQGKGFHPLLSAVEHFDLSAQQDSVKDGQGVTLCTIHAAKGLEWDYVFVPQQIEWTFPLHPRISEDYVPDEVWKVFNAHHKVDIGSGVPNCFNIVLRKWRSLSGEPSSQMDAFEKYCMTHFEEEERLLHVAITRAREAVYLLSTRLQAAYKDGSMKQATTSYFLRHINNGSFTKIFPTDALEQENQSASRASYY